MKLEKRKIVVLGLDGATWDLLTPFMNKGIMPNLNGIIKDGTSGNLMSTIPPYTAPAWVSCTTGVNPGKHGVFGFTLRTNGIPLGEFVDSTCVRVPQLWHYINAAGKTVGMINIPITYPAEPVDGFYVPGFLTPLGKKNYTYPITIYKEFLDPINYIINVRIAQIQHFTENTVLKIVDGIKNAAQKRYEAMEALCDTYQPDFFMIVFTCMDKIQHKFWKYLDPKDSMYNTPFAKKLRPALISVYEQMDMIIGKIKRNLDIDTTLYIVSDHGFGPQKKNFFINKWLSKNGFLKIYKSELIKYRGVLGYRKKMNFSKRNIDVVNNPIFNCIDYKKSRFVSSDPYEQGIYALSGKHDADYFHMISNLKEELGNVKDSKTNENLFKQIYYRDDIYDGDYTHNAADIILEMNHYSNTIVVGYPLKNKIMTTVKKPSGCHHPIGIFAAYGKDIQRGGTVGASIIDIAPTILYQIGLPIQKEMDGKVLESIFSRGFSDTHQITYSSDIPSFRYENIRAAKYSETERSEIAGRLRDLGYLD